MARKNELELVIKADADRAKAAFKSFGKDAADALDGIRSRAFSAQTALVSLAGGVTMGAIAKGGLNIAASFEQLQASLNTITKGEGTRWFAELNKWAIEMPINTEEAIKGFSKMRAMGLKPAIADMTVLVDTAAAVGGDNVMDSFNGIVTALGQMKTKGKASAEELMQLAERNVPVFEILREKLNLTQKELGNIGNAGLDVDLVIKALLEGMADRFGGQSTKMNQTWNGMWENMKATVAEFSRYVITEGGAFEELKGQLKGVTAEFSSWAEVNKNLIAQELPKYIKEITDTAKGIVSFVDAGGSGLAGAGVLGYLFFGAGGAAAVVAGFAAIDGASKAIAGPQTANAVTLKKIEEIEKLRANLASEVKIGPSIFGYSKAEIAEMARGVAAYDRQLSALKASLVETKKVVASTPISTAQVMRGDYSAARVADPEKAVKEAEKAAKKAASAAKKATDEAAKATKDAAQKYMDEWGGNGAWGKAYEVAAEASVQAEEDRYEAWKAASDRHMAQIAQAADDAFKAANPSMDEIEAWAADYTGAYAAMYADTEALSSQRYNLELEQLQKQRKAFVDLTGDEISAQAWFNGKSKALWRDWAYTSGGFVDGVKAAFDELSDEQVKWGAVGYEVVRDFAENSREAVSNLLFDGITGELKDFADYWEATWKSMLRTFTDVLADMAVKWATSKLFGASGGGSLSVGGVASSAGGSLVSGLANSVLGKGVSAVAGWLGIGGGTGAGIGLASTAGTLGTLGVGTPALDALAASVTAETAGAAGAMTALGVLGTAAGIGAAVFAVGKIMDQVLGSDPTKPWSFDVYRAGAAGLAGPLAIGGNSTVTPDVPMTPENFAYYSSPAGMKTWRKAMLAKNRQVNDAVKAAGVETAVNITVNGVVTTDDVGTWAADLAAKNNVFGLTSFANTKTVKAGLQ
ncbi:MAG: tape measure protein [Deltaproteobacteria bacterium]|nr:tape measure protein [Deltaproteobacteria bacterium]